MFCLLELNFLKPNDYEKAALEVLYYLRAKIRHGCRIDYKVVAVQGSVMPIPSGNLSTCSTHCVCKTAVKQ
jgi:hypothetical protein